MDIGLLVTGIAIGVAFLWGRGRWLRHVLLLSWATILFVSAGGFNMAAVVFTMALMDLTIAGAALIISTHNPERYDARVVGGISMALMPAHWAMSATQGAGDWTLYASACNAGFVLQCLIVRGWMDGLGRAINRFVARLRPVHTLRDGGR